MITSALQEPSLGFGVISCILPWTLFVWMAIKSVFSFFSKAIPEKGALTISDLIPQKFHTEHDRMVSSAIKHVEFPRNNKWTTKSDQ
jgi:Na+/pantothenate symporter